MPRNDGPGGVLGFFFQRFARLVHLQLTLQGGGLVSLLHDVRQLVAEQLLSSFGPWVILPCAKDNIASDRVGQRVHAARRFGGARIGMDPDVAEVMPEARFHEGAGCRIQRLTGRA